MFKHILIPTDGSPLSDKATEMGVAMAKAHGAGVTLLTVSTPYHLLSTEAMSLSDTKETYAIDAEKRADTRLKLGLDRAKAIGISARGQHVFADYPFAAIIDAASKHGCDLIVMASHGRSGMTGLLLGSETNKVLINSKIPVLVCR